MLTDTAIRNAKPREKPYKMGDSAGLFLLVQPTGGKLWRLKYRVHGKEQKLNLGIYPMVTLAEARAGRDEARRMMAQGKHPHIERERAMAQAKAGASATFTKVAEEYLKKRIAEGLSPATIAKQRYFLTELGTTLGRMPVSLVEPKDVLAALKKIEAKGNHETAKRTQQFAGRVFRYAVATARIPSDPSRDLRGALTAPKTKHYGAIIVPKKVGELLRAIDGYEGHPTTLFALKLSPHLFVRPGELRHALWEEVDWSAAVWTIPAERMKMRRPHAVPLSKQSTLLFRDMQKVAARTTGLVFPSLQSAIRPMSENTINHALRRLGYGGDEMTAHGFRAMASTLLNESGKWHPDAIERALAHGDANAVRAAYHRGAHWNERVEMAQWWSDYLDELRGGGNR